MTKTVLVCEAQVPFVHGGAELHVREAFLAHKPVISLGDAGYDRARSITRDGVVDRLMADG
jgi:hypothetical protein